MERIEIRNLSKSFETSRVDGTLTVLDGLDCDIEGGSFTTVMGPSGCGKSTFLNILAGIIYKDGGTISVDGTDIDPGDLPFAYVFQEPRLLPWKTVRENIEFVLQAKDIPASEHQNRIDRQLRSVGLADEKDNYPLRLSGGMRQRVGIARALAVDPDVLLMDEPFSELDELTAQTLRQDLIDLWQEGERTVVFVTHDISEAVFLSDTILFMDNHGEIFNEVDVPVPRPREEDDEDLLRIEKRAMRDFFDHVEEVADA